MNEDFKPIEEIIEELVNPEIARNRLTSLISLLIPSLQNLFIVTTTTKDLHMPYLKLCNSSYNNLTFMLVLMRILRRIYEAPPTLWLGSSRRYADQV